VGETSPFVAGEAVEDSPIYVVMGAKENFEMGEGDRRGRQNWKRGIHHKDAKNTESGLIEARFGVAHCGRFFKEF